VLRYRGLAPVDAGLALSLSVLAQAPAALAAPALAARWRDQRAACAGAMGLCLAGLLGCLYAPLASVWAWAVALGLAQGALLGLALAVILLRAPDAGIAAGLSGMAQGVGYLLASAGPFLAGLVYAGPLGLDGVALLCSALAAAAAVCGLGAGRAGHVGRLRDRPAR
jgi:CP family cyanate transporter-like MFS transporter